MQVINDTNIGGRLGAALGSGLQQLAQNKIQALQNQQYQQSLASIPGMNPQMAQLLTNLSPEERKQVWPNIGSLMQLYSAQGQQQAPGQQLAGQPSQQGQLLQDIFTSPQQKQQKELLELKKESNELKRTQFNQTLLEKIETKAQVARELQANAKKALGAIDKAISGPAGAITPKYLQSEEGQYLQSILNRIVILNAQTAKGNPTLGRLKLEEGSKAAVWNKPKVLKKIMQDIIDNPELLEDAFEGDIANNLVEQYGSDLPRDWQKIIKKETKLALSKNKKERAGKFTKGSLPDASKYKEGQIAQNPVTGEDEFVIRNGKWEEL